MSNQQEAEIVPAPQRTVLSMQRNDIMSIETLLQPAPVSASQIPRRAATATGEPRCRRSSTDIPTASAAAP